MSAEMANKTEIKKRQLSSLRWKTVINFLRSLCRATRERRREKFYRIRKSVFMRCTSAETIKGSRIQLRRELKDEAQVCGDFCPGKSERDSSAASIIREAIRALTQEIPYRLHRHGMSGKERNLSERLDIKKLKWEKRRLFIRVYFVSRNNNS